MYLFPALVVSKISNIRFILDGIFETDEERAKGSKIRNEIPKEFASVRTIIGK